MHANATFEFSTPFRVCIPSRGTRVRVGIAATGYRHLCEILQQKYQISGDFYVRQEDGTIVSDEEYFKLLEPNTLLIVIESGRSRPAAAAGQHSNAGVTLGRNALSQTRPAAPPPNQCDMVRLYPSPASNPHLPQSGSYLVQLSPANANNLQGHLPTQYRTVTPPQITNGLGSSLPALTTPPQMTNGSPPLSYTRSPIPGIMSLTSTGANMTSPAHTPHSQQSHVSGTANASPSNLVSQLQISSVMGNVSMSPSPPRLRETQQMSSRSSHSAQPVFNSLSQPTVNSLPAAPPNLPMPQLTPIYHTSNRHVATPNYVAAPYPPTVVVHQPVMFPPSQPVWQSRCVPTVRPPLISPVAHLPFRALGNSPFSSSTPRLQPPCLSQSNGICRDYQQLPLTDDVLENCQRDLALLQRTVAQLHRQRHQHDHMQATPTTTHTVCLPSAAKNTGIHVTSPQQCCPRTHSQSISERTVDWVRNSHFAHSSERIPSQSCSAAVTISSDISENTSPLPPTEIPSQSPRQDAVESQKLATVKVVSCPSESSLLPSGECDEDDRQLCIVEQAPPPTPDAPLPPNQQQDKMRLKPSALHLVPFVQSPLPQSLGNAKYPIILDTETVQSGGRSKSVDACLPDEGYSSSSSPYDTALDFTLQLPFASYEKDGTTGDLEPAEQTEKSVSQYVLAGADTLQTEDQEEKSGDEECDGETEEDYEEDFVMDIDVFSPAAPTTTAKQTKQLPQPLWLPEYLPLEVSSIRNKTTEGSVDEVSRVLSVSISASLLGVVAPMRPKCSLRGRRTTTTEKLVVSIRRDSLSDVPEMPSTPTPTRTSPRLLSSSSFRSSLGSSGTAAPTHTSPKLSSSYSPRLSSLIIKALSRTYKKNRKQLRQRRSSSGTVFCFRAPSLTILTTPQPLIVRVPIDLVKGTNLFRAPVSHVVHSESKYFETCDEKARAEPMVNVAEYGCEVDIPSVCSAEDVSECIEELCDLCNHSNWEGMMMDLDVGDEVVVEELSQESSNSTEMTGMELLNMAMVPRQFDQTTSSPNTTQPVSQDLALDSRGKQNAWKVHSPAPTTSGGLSDPRQKLQHYSLGGENLFELAFSGVTWHLTAL